MSTVLVTGANRGIGLALCKQLCERGDQVIAACRTPSAQLAALRGVRIEPGADVGSDAAMAELAARLRGTRIDTLIANAGVLREDSLATLDLATVHEQLEVNALGPLRTVQQLLPELREGSKIALITSRMGSIGDNTSGGYYGYRMSKAALNAAGVSLAHDLRARGITVAILHPGFVRTEMTDRAGLLDADESAGMLLRRIDALTLETSGGFWHANGERLPW